MKTFRSPRGQSLVSVLISSSLLAIVTMSFLRFTSYAMAAQGNLSKSGQAASLDIGVRSLLANAKACAETMQHLDVSQASADSTVVQLAPIYNGYGQIVFQEGQDSNGVHTDTLRAHVSPLDRGVYSVSVLTTFTKDGKTIGGRSSYSHTDWVNATADASGAITGCFLANPQGVYQLVHTEDVDLTPAAGPSNFAIACNGASTATLDAQPSFSVTKATCGACSGAASSPCLSVTGPSTTVVAQGNYLAVNVIARLGLITVPSENSIEQAVGNRSYVHLAGPGLDEMIPFGGLSENTSVAGHFSVSLQTLPKLYPVQVSQSYTLTLVVESGTGDGTAEYTTYAGSPHGLVQHYLQDGN